MYAHDQGLQYKFQSNIRWLWVKKCGHGVSNPCAGSQRNPHHWSVCGQVTLWNWNPSSAAEGSQRDTAPATFFFFSMKALPLGVICSTASLSLSQPESKMASSAKYCSSIPRQSECTLNIFRNFVFVSLVHTQVFISKVPICFQFSLMMFDFSRCYNVMLSGLYVNPKVVLTPGEMELTLFVMNKHILYANDN